MKAAVVRIETCGLCHTDIHAARGEWPVRPKDLLIMASAS